MTGPPADLNRRHEEAFFVIKVAHADCRWREDGVDGGIAKYEQASGFRLYFSRCYRVARPWFSCSTLSDSEFLSCQLNTSRAGGQTVQIPFLPKACTGVQIRPGHSGVDGAIGRAGKRTAVAIAASCAVLAGRHPFGVGRRGGFGAGTRTGALARAGRVRQLDFQLRGAARPDGHRPRWLQRRSGARHRRCRRCHPAGPRLRGSGRRRSPGSAQSYLCTSERRSP